MKLKDPNTQYYHGYKFLIYPTEEQKIFINKCFGASRFVYNWVINKEQEQYQLYLDGKIEKKESFLSEYTLDKMFTALRHSEGYEWLLDIPLSPCRSSIIDAVYSFKRYFKKLSEKPKFKLKGGPEQSYSPRSDRFYIYKDGTLYIDGLGRGNTISINNNVLEYDFTNVQFSDTTISRDNLGQYWVSFAVLSNKPLIYFNDNNIPKSEPVGIDLNLRRDARIVCSNGMRFEAPDTDKKERRIKILQRKVQKDNDRLKEQEKTNPDAQKSKRAQKRQIKLRKVYKKVSDINNTFIDTSIKKIVDTNPSAIIMEDLKVEDGIKKNKYTAPLQQKAALGTIRTKMEKKANTYNIPFIKAPEDYPSTQKCSKCGAIKEMSISQHVYICPKCGNRMDRDENAALNLKNLAYENHILKEE